VLAFYNQEAETEEIMTINGEIEFSQLSENIRHWEKLRWISMTVFIAIMFGGLTALFQYHAVLTIKYQTAIKVIGLIIVFVFWVQDERIVQYWFAYKLRAHEIEEKNNIKVFSVSPERGIFSAAYAVRGLYLTFFVVWLMLLLNV
jgi:hypothetical protein